jgi:hypothetical protein
LGTPIVIRGGGIVYFYAPGEANGKTMEQLLPEQFKELESFLSWACNTERERSARRHSTTMLEIRAFYDAMIAHLEEILNFLSGFADENAPADVKRLSLLTLALAEIAPAVENFNQQDVVDGYEYSRFVAVHD